MLFDCPLPVPADSDQGKSYSSRLRTNRYTTHVRSRTSQIGRKHSALIVRPAQDRSSNEHGSQDVMSADHYPKGRPFLRRRLAPPVPTRLPWVADNASRSLPKATRNRRRVEPRNCHHRLLRMTEVGIAPVRGRHVPGGVQKPRVLRNRDLRCRHGKGIYPDAMNRPFHILTSVGPHGEPAGGDVDLRWLGDRHATGE